MTKATKEAVAASNKSSDNVPDNKKLPFFAYGLFKPDQLAYERIKEFVDENETANAWMEGKIHERDGLPILKLGRNLGRAHGVLMTFREGCEVEAYVNIAALEPRHQYYWKTLHVDYSGGSTTANALIGKRPKNGGHPIEEESWDGYFDPLWTTGLDLVKEILKDARTLDKPDVSRLEPVFRLEMGYMLLWSAIERYASFRYFLGRDPWQKVKKLADEPAFQSTLRKVVSSPRKLYRADNMEPITLRGDNPQKAIEYYYQVRSNVTHRGKAAFTDFDILLASTCELLKIFKKVIEDTYQRKELKDE